MVQRYWRGCWYLLNNLSLLLLNKKEYNRAYWERVKSNPELKNRIQISRSKASKKWERNNKEWIKEYARKYRLEHPEKTPLRQRFEILKRFNFKCQYCGRNSQESVLEIDHIVPKAKGGLNKNENLTVACRECNVGKSDVLLKN